MQTKLLLATVISIVLLGAGCASSTSSTVKSTTPATTKATATTTIKTTPATTTPVALTCPTDTTSFVASKLNLEFCYPTKDDDGAAITVTEKTDGVVLSVAGTPTRKIALVSIPTGKTAADYIKSTYVNSKVTTGTTCTVDSASFGKNGTQYSIYGSMNGEQGLEASDACNDNGVFAGLLEGLGGAVYITYPTAPSTLYVLSGEQDALLGFKHTDDFQNSIQPKFVVFAD